jgi:AcrR family transcriptional regulator
MDPTGTKLEIVEAAVETLKTAGFHGSSAREIARTGGFNQALIFYHFGTVRQLLLAALDPGAGIAGQGDLPRRP